MGTVNVCAHVYQWAYKFVVAAGSDLSDGWWGKARAGHAVLGL